MITVDLRSRVPIYEQIVESVRSAILQGLIKPDEQLPAVRKLAVELAINPNTIQKAYSILEQQHIVYSLPGRGSFVSSDTSALMDKARAVLTSELEQAFSKAKTMGIAKSDLISLLDESYGKE